MVTGLTGYAAHGSVILGASGMPDGLVGIREHVQIDMAPAKPPKLAALHKEFHWSYELEKIKWKGGVNGECREKCEGNIVQTYFGKNKGEDKKTLHNPAQDPWSVVQECLSHLACSLCSQWSQWKRRAEGKGVADDLKTSVQ